MARESQKSNARVRFRCYGLGGNSGSIHAWYDSLPAEVQAGVDAVLETLGNSRRPWPNTLFERLHGACYGLAEIKIEVEQTTGETTEPDAEVPPEHYRILVWEGQGRNDVTLLYGFKKENNADYGPACRSALRRRDGVKKDANRAPPCAFP
jgi:hypothetical protein